VCVESANQNEPAIEQPRDERGRADQCGDLLDLVGDRRAARLVRAVADAAATTGSSTVCGLIGASSADAGSIDNGSAGEGSEGERAATGCGSGDATTATTGSSTAGC